MFLVGNEGRIREISQKKCQLFDIDLVQQGGIMVPVSLQSFLNPSMIWEEWEAAGDFDSSCE